MGMFQLMQSQFIFLDSVKAILLHCAHRLLSESTLILCTLKTATVESRRPAMVILVVSRFGFPTEGLQPKSCLRFARPRLNVGELPRFYNQLRHLATLSHSMVRLGFSAFSAARALITVTSPTHIAVTNIVFFIFYLPC